MVRLVRELKIDSKEVEGRMCTKESDGKLCFCDKEKGKI